MNANAATILFDENGEGRFDEKAGFVAILSFAKLGIPEGRQLNYREKKMLGNVVPNADVSSVVEGISVENASKIASVYQIYGQRISMAILQYALCFACADGIVEPEVEDRLESIFGMSLLADFFQSGQESVPTPRHKVTLTPLENDIVQWLNKDKGMPPLKKIQSHFSSYSASAVTQALKHLETLGLVSGGEKLIDNAYYLIDDVFENSDITVDRSQEKAQKAAQAKAKAEAEAEKKKKQEDVMDDYNLKYAQWQKNCEEVEKNREKMISRLCEEEKKKFIANAEKDHAHQAKYLGKKIEGLEKEKTSAEAKLSSLGFFKFREKSEQRAVISQLNDQLAEANEALSENEETYQTALSNTDEAVEQKRESFKTRATQKYPMPNEPIKPPTEAEIANQRLKEDILMYMVPGEFYLIEDIEEMPCCNELSKQKIISLLSQLTQEGKVVRTYEKRKAYFSIM